MQRNVKMLIVVLDEYFSNLTHLCEQHACPRREHLQMPSLYPHQTVPTPTGDHQQHGFVQTFFVLQVKPFFCVGFIYLFIWWWGGVIIIIYLVSVVAMCPLVCLASFASYLVYQIRPCCCMQL